MFELNQYEIDNKSLMLAAKAGIFL